MEDRDLLERIDGDPEIMRGKPVIEGTRLTVEYVLNLLAHDATFDEIVDEYDDLRREDVQAALLFAQKYLADPSFILRSRNSG